MRRRRHRVGRTTADLEPQAVTVLVHSESWANLNMDVAIPLGRLEDRQDEMAGGELICLWRLSICFRRVEVPLLRCCPGGPGDCNDGVPKMTPSLSCYES